MKYKNFRVKNKIIKRGNKLYIRFIVIPKIRIDKIILNYIVYNGEILEKKIESTEGCIKFNVKYNKDEINLIDIKICALIYSDIDGEQIVERDYIIYGNNTNKNKNNKNNKNKYYKMLSENEEENYNLLEYYSQNSNHLSYLF